MKYDFYNFFKINQNISSIADYNNKQNAILKNEIHNIKYENLDELFFFLEQSIKNTNNLAALKPINERIELNTYNIKGILTSFNYSHSSINKYTELFIDALKYDIKLELYKISNCINNKLSFPEKIKYDILISNLNKENKDYIEKIFLNHYRPVFVITNLEATLVRDKGFGNIGILFRNTYQTKIYMEINKNKDDQKSKYNFIPSGIYIDYFKSNEFSYMDWISTEKLFFGRKNKTKMKSVKNYNFEIDIDLKTYLEIETDSLYVENIKDEFLHFNPLKNERINICCYVKSITEDKRKKIYNVNLENLYDLNNIILEIPKESKIMDKLYVNCIYIFINLIIFIDENMNIRLTIQKNQNEKTELIFVYLLIDREKYYNKKLNDFLIHNQFSQLLPVVSQNKIIRIMQKYLVIIDKIYFFNLYLNESKEISYDGLVHCSDRTSTALLRIAGNNILDLKKLSIKLSNNIYHQLNLEKHARLCTSLNNIIQLIIIGNPVMENVKELSFLEIYDDINLLKNSKSYTDLITFDLLLVKNEYKNINGALSKYSTNLEIFPVIKVNNLFTLEEYINIIETEKNKSEGI